MGIERINIDPPWLAFPDYTPSCTGFRMGAGEDYIDKWWEFWKALNNEEKCVFKTNYPAPVGWDIYYC